MSPGGLIVGVMEGSIEILRIKPDGQILCRDDSGRMIAVRLAPHRLARLLAIKDGAQTLPGGPVWDIMMVLAAELAGREN